MLSNIPKISIIVPVYRTEKYLRECIDSILNQTYRNLEVLLIDDGSPDKSGEICEAYASKDNRIRVFHTINKGLSSARNLGLMNAEGEFIGFVDSDDWIEPNMYEALFKAIQKTDSDICMCRLWDETNASSDPHVSEVIFKGNKSLEALITGDITNHVWNKLYKSEIALKIPFEKGKLNEDEFWTYRVFGQAEKVTKINKSMYFYLQRSGSIMGNKFNIRRLDALEAKAERQKYIEANFPNLAKQAKIDLFATCIFMCQSAMKFMKGKEKKQAKKAIKEYVGKIKLNNNDFIVIDRNSRFWFKFANKYFYLCCKIRRITGIGF